MVTVYEALIVSAPYFSMPILSYSDKKVPLSAPLPSSPLACSPSPSLMNRYVIVNEMQCTWFSGTERRPAPPPQYSPSPAPAPAHSQLFPRNIYRPLPNESQLAN